MGRAFDTAFAVIKMDYFTANHAATLFDLLLIKASDDNVLRGKVEDYLNMSFADLIELSPDEKEYAFALIREHMASRPKSMVNPQGTVTEEEEEEVPEEVAKAVNEVISYHYGLLY